jgi:alpha-L-rhamnosidase
MLGAPRRLRCEYLHNPLGIDIARPRLSWCIDDPRPAEIQTAYQLLAASSDRQLANDVGNLWDSGRVSSRQSLNVEFGGERLRSGQRVWWKVRSYDSDGMPSPWSEPCWFEMGQLAAEDWRGSWISTPLQGSAATPVTVPMLRRAFDASGAVAVARLYISAQGLYSAQLNGREITSDVLTPPWTSYATRVSYQTYDVTELLGPGENVLGVLLADGWYAGEPGLGPRQQYGPVPKLLAQLNIEFASGEAMQIVTDQSWKWHRSWLLSSDLILGESVDARQCCPGWSEPGLDEAGWSPVLVDGLSDQSLSAGAYPRLRVLEEVAPLAVPDCVTQALQPARRVYDFGRAIFGRVRLVLDAEPGVPIRLRYGLAITDQGQLANPVDAGVDHYTTAGVAGERFEPVFAVHGFRYVELSADVPDSALLAISALAIGCELDGTGHFSSDHAFLNELLDELRLTQQTTLQHVPTAGITAGERLGYTAMARDLLEVNARQLDVAGLYGKWLGDLVDAQLPDGGFPPIVPAPPGVPAATGDGGAGWSDAFVDSAWSLYRQFGDRRALERCYAPLRKYMAGLQRRFPELLCEGPVHPLATQYDQTTGDVIATARYFQTAKLAARIAGVLGRIADLEEFEALAQGIRSAFRRRYVTMEGQIVGDVITSHTLALHLGLLDGPERHVAFDRLVCRLQGGSELSPNPAHAPYLLQVLTGNGRLDLAYQWLLGPGRATLAGTPRDMLEKSTLATVCEWLYTGLAGLNLDADLSETHNAYRQVVIQPRPPIGLGFGRSSGAAAGADDGAYAPPLRWVSASLDTVNGRYECSWELTEAAFELRLVIPGNCSGLVILPDASERSVESGRHEFRMAYVEPGDGIPILREVSQAS